MRILVIGSGGREHALVWKISQSERVEKIYAAPGNPGIASLAECVEISISDIRLLADFAEEKQIDLTVVGPELPLTLGIGDEFDRRGLRLCGPRQEAALLEGSKVFAKRFMKKYRIPTGFFQTFYRAEDAKHHVQEIGGPLVVKANGLAAGKGAVICPTTEAALDAITAMMENRIFGDAGERVVIEEYLTGEEASVLAFTDGETVLPLPACQDHKALHDNDQGPNTGGMGAYCPAPVITEEMTKKIMEQILIPTVRGMAAEGKRYRGILYAGLMIHEGEPKVLEFNARFGDPEAQALLVRMHTDIVPICEAVVEHRLHEAQIQWRDEAAVCVVLCADGYPGVYERGKQITGLSTAARLKDVVIFHAGTRRQGNRYVTDGGRVLGVTALGPTLPQAITRAYRAVGKIHWEGAHYRTDIGKKALPHLGITQEEI